ncbi:hypothetical protein A3842_25500 [Paenibacillus sp. P3E]|nr:hypothetical protein A3842_25500 [Paenibacillus sp. P3E]
MRFRNNSKMFRIIITLLYPFTIFWLLCLRGTLDSWLIPIIVTILFCLLWDNLRQLITSTILMWVIAVPLWWLLIERTKEGQAAIMFSNSLPFIILAFIFIVLIPEILLVSIKNSFLNKFL